MKQPINIPEIDLHNAPSIYDKVDYIDGDLLFADNITTIPNLSQVFRVNFYAFLFCLHGELTLDMNGDNHHLSANDGLFVDDNSVIDHWEHSEDFRCVICGFKSDVAFNFINKSLFTAMMQLRSQPVIHFTPDEIMLMVRYYELAKFKMEHPELNFGKETMVNILRGLAYDLLSNISRHLDTEGNMLRQGDKLFRRFVLMLAEGSPMSRSVKSCADELCVTPKYLSSICRQHAGKTASELIAQSMVGHIKQLLLYSDLTIKEIATKLGFGNLSFFGKYVKKHLGMSPNNFRRLNGYGK